MHSDICYMAGNGHAGAHPSKYFDAAKRRYETEVLGRFPELAPTHKRKYPLPHWVVTMARQEALDKLTTTLRVPTGWAPLKKMFRHTNFMTSSQAIQCVGPVGTYFIQFWDCMIEYRDLWIEYLLGMYGLKHKISVPEEREAMETKIRVSGTKLEIKLPTYWNTMVLLTLIILII